MRVFSGQGAAQQQYRIGGLGNAEGSASLTLDPAGVIGTSVVTVRAIRMGAPLPAFGAAPLMRVKDLTLVAETWVTAIVPGKNYKALDMGGFDLLIEITGGTGTGLALDAQTLE